MRGGNYSVQVDEKYPEYFVEGSRLKMPFRIRRRRCKEYVEMDVNE